MLNKDAKMAEAQQFQSEGDCYIHIEMKGGKGCEILIAGHGLAMLHGLAGAISRVSEKNGVSFDYTLGYIQEMYHAGRKD